MKLCYKLIFFYLARFKMKALKNEWSMFVQIAFRSPKVFGAFKTQNNARAKTKIISTVYYKHGHLCNIFKVCNI